MEQRCVLLPAQQGPFQAPQLLPPGTPPQEVFDQGRIYEASAVGGGRLFWTEGNGSGWESNAVASGLVPGVQVRGDAVLALPPGTPEHELHLRVATLAAKHLSGYNWRPRSTHYSAAGTRRGASSGGRAGHGVLAGGLGELQARQEQPWEPGRQKQQLLMRLLRHPAGASASSAPPLGAAAAAAAAEAAPPAAAPAAATASGEAPATPAAPPTPCPVSAAAPGGIAPETAVGQQQGGERREEGERLQWVLEERRAACQRRQERQRGLQRQQEPPHHHETMQVFECEPRQSLLWSIAGRATSLSWQSGGGTAGTAGAGAGAEAAARVSAAPVAAAAVAPAGASSACPAGAVASTEQQAAAQGVSVEMSWEAQELALRSASPPVPAPVPAAGEPAPPPLVLPAKHHSSLDHSPWADLQPEMLVAVLTQAGHSAEVARGLCQVCSAWRRGLAEERGALQQLRFAALRRLQPGAHSGSSSSRSSGSGCRSGGESGSSAELPWLVQRAVKAGNVAAAVLAARWLEGQVQGGRQAGGSASSSAAAASDSTAAATWYGGSRGSRLGGQGSSRSGGNSSEAALARLWAKAAKLGHPEAQWKIGYANYKGLMGLPHNGEEAVLWLSRAARQLSEVAGPGRNGSSSSSTADRSGSTSASAAAAGKRLPVLMSAADCRDTLAQAAHILGYLHLDGEGTKADVAAAIRWFRLAEAHGCRDAGRVLGSLFNSGMYG